MSLSFIQLYEFGMKESAVIPSKNQISSVETSYHHLKNALEMGQKFYGIHTGFGANVTTKVNDHEYKKHQLNLLNYLKVGTGKFLSEKIVRRALNLQLLKVAQGFSGVHPETFKRLAQFVQSESFPSVPEYGSLGASGDLIPMAHAIAPLFSDENEFGPRDVLALVNTNAMMASYAIELFHEVKIIVQNTIKVTALNSLALCTQDEPFSDNGLSINQHLFPHVLKAGQQIIQEREKWKNKYSKEVTEFYKNAENYSHVTVQERYSIRCSPQILGNALSQLEFVESRIMAEALAVNDNPLVLPENNSNLNNQKDTASAWHGGLFYTASLASSIDMLMDILGRVTELADRQVLLLMHPQTSHGLPENLGTEDELHLKGIHQLISALQQQMRSVSVPSRLLSFSAESNNQDVLPCSMAALHNLNISIDISKQIFKASLFVAERACCYRFNLNIPVNLKLESWPNYKIEEFI